MWLPALGHTRGPSPMHALLDPLQPHHSLLDIGAGVGLYSLAAAAQGNKVLAFETGASNLQALHDSAEYNGLAAKVQLFEGLPDAALLDQRAEIAAVHISAAGLEGSIDDDLQVRVWATSWQSILLTAMTFTGRC